MIFVGLEPDRKLSSREFMIDVADFFADIFGKNVTQSKLVTLPEVQFMFISAIKWYILLLQKYHVEKFVFNAKVKISNFFFKI